MVFSSDVLVDTLGFEYCSSGLVLKIEVFRANFHICMYNVDRVCSGIVVELRHID